MPGKKPLFAVGDMVRERFPFERTSLKIGTITEMYQLDEEYRYAVKFDSDREEVFFERELLKRD